MSRNILVTGATGFVGGALARRLVKDGDRVVGTGRNLQLGQALQRDGVDFRPVDLTDRAAMHKLLEGIERVVHAGAIASPWAPPGAFEAVNVGGTRNVVDACVAHGVQRLVYVSTPAVLSRFREQYDLTEDMPPPSRFVSDYARTKYAGEVITADAAHAMETVIIRPKAVYGPGDNAIFPRILDAARRGRLPRVGNGDTVTNITYIDDVVDGLVAGLDAPEAAGNTYVLAGQRVRIWDLVANVLGQLGVPQPRRHLTTAAAMRLAGALERGFATVRREPPLTRYAVGILGYSQTYDTSAAASDLGFAPITPLDVGVARYVASLQSTESARDLPTSAPAAKPTPMAVHVASAGSTAAPAFAFQPGGGLETVRIPAMFAWFEHPTEGVVVFDTGYSPRFVQATQAFPARLYRWLTPSETSWETSAAAIVSARDAAPEDVRWVLLSHFDPDHYGGLRDFPNARFVVTAEAWAAARDHLHRPSVAALVQRILPDHFPEDMAARVQILPPFRGPAIGPFDASHDLFGDGAIRAVALPGHAPGQYGVWVRRSADDKTMFFAADGCWTRASLQQVPVFGGAHARIAVDKPAQRATYQLLASLVRDFPDVELIPTHCPDAARSLGVQY